MREEFSFGRNTLKKSISRFWTRGLPWIALIHAVLFVLFWLTNRLFYDSVNTYLFEKIGMRLDYVSMCLVFALMVALGVLLVLVSRHQQIKRGWAALVAVLGILFILFFYGSFLVLFKQDPTQPVRLWRMLRYNGLYFYGLLLAVFVLLFVLFVQPYMKKHPGAGKFGKAHVIIDSILIFGLLWGAALWIPPASVVRGELPAKPLVIGHRGSAALAPENTIASAELAVELGADGVETDIRISKDGVPFLMHDKNLLRTTNVAEVFPGREKEDASLFTWAELQRLNAGRWFEKADPFGTIADGKVRPEILATYANEKIPSLEQELAVVKQNDLIFIFDLLAPIEGHPYQGMFFNICFEQIKQAGIDGQVWFLLDDNQLAMVREQTPDMIAIYGADFQSPSSLEFLQMNGYKIVNVGNGLPDKWIRTYREGGLDVNLYTVDEVWLFSDLWMNGATSMTTNHVQEMGKLEKPVGSMSFGTYLGIWAAVGIIGVAVLVFFALKKQ
jgi:glycerophosphoryl diester phosphodiesterase